LIAIKNYCTFKEPKFTKSKFYYISFGYLCNLSESKGRSKYIIIINLTEWLMPKYLIEREIPGAGNLSTIELQAISQKSCNVLRNMGPEIQWVQSYVAGDKIYCVYIAPNADMIKEHAKQGGFPANQISEVKTIIDPTTSEV